ncbi:ESF1 homolog [Hippocampus zosterae]|uniref:ESF1 homolog n=1 Tax=Hippocampus zosterae TaxID=109293 RepID=UPI00223DD996|nr:ESF1 homolog [Hippocampus zosterae]
MSSQKSGEEEDGAPADARFSRVRRDPRFWEMPERQRKVAIDKRFASMFHDERFQVKCEVDKRGRPVRRSAAEDLRRFYQIPEGESDQGRPDEDDDEEEGRDESDDESRAGSSGGEEDEGSSNSDGPDLARGQGNVETSSDEGEEAEEEEEIQHDWGELCKDAERSEQVWRRLAVCNVDWDRLKAKDLLATLDSFKPEGGAVLSVKIYPSEFGKERLRLEESQGPPELRAPPADSDDDGKDDRSYREKKRDYQFKRLKYFYAVAECDSAATAAKIYQECDGLEYESSSSVLDLRFIPDDMTFEEPPRDAAADVNLATYAPKFFTSAASATSKVELTWDQTDPERVSALRRKFNKSELLDMDFAAYLASSSSSGEGEEDEPEPEGEDGRDAAATGKSQEQLDKYRRLLGGLRREQSEQNMEMEVTWVPGLREATEQLVKKKQEQERRPTPWEDFLRKKRDKKKAKKNGNKERHQEDGQPGDDRSPDPADLDEPFFRRELVAAGGRDEKKKKRDERERAGEEGGARARAEMSLLMDDEDDGRKHFNYDKLVEQQNLSGKKKKKMLKSGDAPPEDNFQVDVSDPRFQAVFTSHLFNLDPSHPSYKRTRATQSILDEKRRRREEADRGGGHDDGEARAVPREGAQRDAGLSLLVKSVKSKTRDFQARKKAKRI